MFQLLRISFTWGRCMLKLLWIFFVVRDIIFAHKCRFFFKNLIKHLIFFINRCCNSLIYLFLSLFVFTLSLNVLWVGLIFIHATLSFFYFGIDRLLILLFLLIFKLRFFCFHFRLRHSWPVSLLFNIDYSGTQHIVFSHKWIVCCYLFLPRRFNFHYSFLE